MSTDLRPDAATARATRRGPAHALARALPLPAGAGMARMMVERNCVAFRHAWITIVSGFFEPVFYLFSMGVGIGALIGAVTLDGGRQVEYAEIGWALLRGLVYSVAFYLVALAAGLVQSWWSLLAIPAASLIGFAFAAVGMACTTYMRSWQDFDYVQLAILPMFLFSTTFFPLSTFPTELHWVMQATPLFHGVQMVRDLVLGSVSPGILWHVAYLVAMGLVGVVVASRRLETLLLK